MQSVYNFVHLNKSDNVAVALDNIPKGEFIKLTRGTIALQEDIEFGHKIAVQPIKKGEFIVKYGEVIGKATSFIKIGEHVHLHNVEGNRGRGDN